MNKRVLIGVALGILGLFAVTGIGLVIADSDRQLGAFKEARSYAAGNSFIEIDGVSAGAVKSVSGCETSGDVVKAAPGTDGVIRKHVSVPRYEPCVLEVTSGMGQSVYDWIRAMLNRNAGLKNVTLIEADYNYKEKSRLQLQNAALTKVVFPALDASSKDSATIELTLLPEAIQRSTAGAGTDLKGLSNSAKQKAWLASNYRVTVSGGLPSTRIASISAFEVTQEVAQNSVGETKEVQKQASKLELGDLTVAVSAVDTNAWDAWFKSFVVDGNNSQTDEKTATIELMSPNMKDVLLSLSLQGVGIFRAGALSAGSTDKISGKTYSLYVEEAALSPLMGSGGTTPPPPPPPPSAGTTTGQTASTTIAEATILAVAGTSLLDGETFTISDGSNEPTTFEFDFDGKFSAVPIKVSKESPTEEVAAAIVEAINGVPETLEIMAKPTGEAQIQIVSARADAEGQEKILEFVEDESFKVQDKVVEQSQDELPPPTGLVAETGGAEGEVTLSWTESPGALGYIVLFATEPGGEYLELDKSEETKLTLAGLDSRVTHYFVVRALDGNRESANSEEASASAG